MSGLSLSRSFGVWETLFVLLLERDTRVVADAGRMVS